MTALPNLFPNCLCYNGEQRDIQELIDSKCEISDFLSQWYDNRDVISVKTSGSTGKPKAIELNKIFVAQSAQRTLNYFNLQKNDRILLCLPMHYIAGKLMLVRALLGQLDLCTLPANSNFSLLSQLPNNHFHFVAMVVNQVAKLMAKPNAFNSIETLLIGGSSLPSQLETELQKIPTACYLSYGMTETATHVALRAVNGGNRSQCYHCLEDITVSLDNDCLVIALANEKCLHTNDIAKIYDNKTFKIIGRSDNVIISGGIKFIPEAIEEKISPYINENYFIASQADNTLGDKIVLVIESVESDELKRQIETICKRHLSTYERPKAIIFKPLFQRTKTDKIIRKP